MKYFYMGLIIAFDVGVGGKLFKELSKEGEFSNNLSFKLDNFLRLSDIFWKSLKSFYHT